SFNFVAIPTIASRHPLWEDRLGEEEMRSNLQQGLLLDHGRETIGTSVVDARPEVILKMPGDSIVPFLYTVALTVLFVAALLHWWWTVGWATLATLIFTIAWLWPRDTLAQTAEVAHA
ncbi:MAG TPA: cytochrome ubiquinol oxidase subunit I, partial [Methylophilaceae bacterium]|nr:cytochrome ubiquinol oxidase subunit I [Methylophilaceae bacterium]